MRIQFRLRVIGALSCALSASTALGDPFGSAFTYQGQLKQGGSPLTGTADLKFTLWNDPVATALANQVGGTQLISTAPISNGLFTVQLDFGVAAFNGEGRWLQIAVSPTGSGDFSTLAPRQPISPAPYAIQTKGIFANDLGSVGIGTTTPATKLHMNGQALWLTGGNGSALPFSAGSGLRMYYDSTNSYASIFAWDYSPGQPRNLVLQQPGGNIGIGTTTPNVPLDVITPNGDDTFNVGIRTSRHSGGTTALRIGNYMKTANFRQGGMIAADQSLNLVYNNSNAGFSFNVFNNVNDYDVDIASPVLSCGTDGSTTVRVLHITGGSDLAEPFVIRSNMEGADSGSVPPECERLGLSETRRDEAAIRPGAVVVIDPENPGQLKLANDPYDPKVAGVISGANGLKPGMIMKAEGQPHADGEHPVALAGRVWCWCDASYGSIVPGDRLTTSATPGHAMKVIDKPRAPGAVIGKAMTRLESGKGLVLVLVQPQ